MAVSSTRAQRRITADRCSVKTVAQIPTLASTRIAPASAETAQPTVWKAIAAAAAWPVGVPNSTWPGRMLRLNIALSAVAAAVGKGNQATSRNQIKEIENEIECRKNVEMEKRGSNRRAGARCSSRRSCDGSQQLDPHPRVPNYLPVTCRSRRCAGQCCQERQ